MPKTGKKIIFSDNLLWSIVNFRGDVIRHFIREGYEVVLVAPEVEPDFSLRNEIPEGARFVPVNMDRCGTNPYYDLKYFCALYRIYKRERADYIFHYTIKANIYGTFAARLLRIPSSLVITGLGYAFNNATWSNRLAVRMYKSAARLADHVIVLNKNNRDSLAALLKLGQKADQKILWFKGGEGVNLDRFKAGTNMSADGTTFLFVSRILSDKGYYEFVNAARQVKAVRPDARFQLLGTLDSSNPQGVSLQQIEQDVASGAVEYLGTTDDVPSVEGKPGTVVTLPSYYNEGLSRALMEGCAMGKPIITTDCPGCRETVRDGVNGYLIAPRSAEALAKACMRYLELSEAEKTALSQASRQLAEKEFDVRLVIEHYERIVNAALR